MHYLFVNLLFCKKYRDFDCKHRTMMQRSQKKKSKNLLGIGLNIWKSAPATQAPTHPLLRNRKTFEK